MQLVSIFNCFTGRRLKSILLGTHLIPSTSSGATHQFCCECSQSLVNRKHEIENMKTKNKLDQLKLVMQQKKERREARKLKIAPYNSQPELAPVVFGTPVTATTICEPELSANESLNGSGLMMPGTSSSSLNESTDSNTSSSATATAIATSISTNNSEIENHLEEVDTVA